MGRDDTIKLLRECNSGVKMGVAALNEVIDHVKDSKMKDMLLSCKKTHSDLGNETHHLLDEYHDKDKEPDIMAKGMSWIKTNVKLAMNDSDATIADLLTDGCNMGVKSLYRYLNQYKDAEEKVKNLTNRLIDSEKKLTDDLREYL